MRILVTGSSGFIGFHLCKKLLEFGHEVVGLDNHSDYYDIKLKELRLNQLYNENFSFHLCDINNISLINSEFDLAINLAAQAGVRVKKENEYLYKSTNVDGFESFCRYCADKNIKNIIYASSSSVYSDEGIQAFNEKNTKLSPKSMYGRSKLENEIFAKNFSESYGLNMLGLRFFSVYGPWGRPDMAYFFFTRSLHDGSKIYLNNHGKMKRDMTYIDDIIDGTTRSINYLMTKNNEFSHEIFNLGNNKPVETAYLLSKLESLLGIKGNIVHKKTTNESLFTHADLTKSKSLLGYNPQYNFNVGINNFLRWYKDYERY